MLQTVPVKFKAILIVVPQYMKDKIWGITTEILSFYPFAAENLKTDLQEAGAGMNLSLEFVASHYFPKIDVNAIERTEC